jgi:hypothetical protein
MTASYVILTKLKIFGSSLALAFAWRSNAGR